METGRGGEDAALKYLLSRGMKLLERNYRFGHKEIDLIMQDGMYLVFVEVKARTSVQYGTPGEAVTGKKQSLLIKAAQGYMMTHHRVDDFARFDVVEVELPSETVTGYIRDAFWMN